MATDPTRTIQARDLPTELSTDLRAVAQQVAAIPPSTDIPIVTITLDWRIEGTNPGREPFYDEGMEPEDDTKRSSPRRPAAEQEAESARRRPSRREFQDRMDELVRAHGPRGDVYESLSGDFERITAYLDGEIDPEAHGALIVSCSAKGVFQAYPLALPLPTAVTPGPIAAIADLVRVSEDMPSYAVLLADQENARLTFFRHANPARTVKIEGSSYPRHQQQGGWSQRRYQARAEEKVEAFARDVAEETRKELDAQGVNRLVLAGAEEMLVALDSAFHQTVKDHVVGTIHLDMRASTEDILAASEPVIAKAERSEEQAAVEQMSDGVGAGTYGAGGAADVLTALQAGQVMMLVMNDDFQGEGWADFTMPAFGVGDLPTSHPLGGERSNLVPVDLRNMMATLAVQSGAVVEVVHTGVSDDDEDFETVPQAGGNLPRSRAAIALDAFGGVGAVLRYAVGDEPSEEESSAQARDDDRH
jgi:hypothetical protein